MTEAMVLILRQARRLEAFVRLNEDCRVCGYFGQGGECRSLVALDRNSEPAPGVGSGKSDQQGGKAGDSVFGGWFGDVTGLCGDARGLL